jgi:hypothetical protein
MQIYIILNLLLILLKLLTSTIHSYPVMSFACASRCFHREEGVATLTVQRKETGKQVDGQNETETGKTGYERHFRKRKKQQ